MTTTAAAGLSEQKVRELMLYATKGMSAEDKADIIRCATNLAAIAYAAGAAAASVPMGDPPVLHLLHGIRLQLREARLSHDWLTVSNVEEAVYAACRKIARDAAPAMALPVAQSAIGECDGCGEVKTLMYCKVCFDQPLAMPADEEQLTTNQGVAQPAAHKEWCRAVNDDDSDRTCNCKVQPAAQGIDAPEDLTVTGIDPLPAAQDQPPLALARAEAACGGCVDAGPTSPDPDDEKLIRELIAAAVNSMDQTAIGSTCRLIRAESAIHDRIRALREECARLTKVQKHPFFWLDRAERAEAKCDAAVKALRRCHAVMHGDGVMDQGQAWDECVRVLDAAVLGDAP